MHRDPLAACALRVLQRRSMTVTQLSLETGINRGTLSRWLSGHRSISTAKAWSVMTALGITVMEDTSNGQDRLEGHGRSARGPDPPH